MDVLALAVSLFAMRVAVRRRPEVHVRDAQGRARGGDLQCDALLAATVEIVHEGSRSYAAEGAARRIMLIVAIARCS